MDGGSARWRALGLLSLAELLALSLWFSASAVLPALSREWALGDGGRAGLTIAVQAGFIVGTLAAALTNLPDILPAARAHDVGRAGGRGRERGAGALGRAPDPRARPALSHRRLPGRHLPARDEDRRHLVPRGPRARDRAAGRPRSRWARPRRTSSAASPICPGATPCSPPRLAAALGALAVTLVTEGPYRFPPARFDLRMATAVLRERGPRLACFGYFGHMWELYAMWAWLAAFLAASLEARGGGSYAGLNASAATFVCVGLAGGPRRLGGRRARRPLGPHHAHHGRHGALRPVRPPDRARPSAARRC